jgi:hypothetical protein
MLSVAGGEGKKNDEGTMIPEPEVNSKSDTVAVGDPREKPILTAATTREAFDTPINCRNQFWENSEN